MCLILFALRAHPRYPLVVAANRDEAYARPSAAAAFWDEHADVYGGRDLEHGGTWLALTRRGRFAAITNYRQGLPRAPRLRSRGELTRDFLSSDGAAAAYLHDVESRAGSYNGFSMLAGRPDELWFYSNRGAGPQAVAPGVHGLSNHLLDEPWPKVTRGIASLQALLGADDSVLAERLLDLLADRAAAPDHLLPRTGIELDRERMLSASFIAGETYGTRASTVVIVDADGETLFVERSFGPGGALTGETRGTFTVELARQSSSSSGRSGSSLSSIAR